MPAVLLLAVALWQQPFEAPPQEVLRSEPDSALLGGGWRLLGPIPARGTPDGGSALAREQQRSMRAGEPWPALDQPFEAHDGVRRLWRDVDLDSVADAAAAELLHPRLREGCETGRIALERLPVLDADEGPRSALLYRAIHARERGAWTAELRHTGSLRLWLNGVVAAESDGAAADAPHRVTLEFEPGLNHMVIETDSPDSGSWSFELRHRHTLTQAAINRAIGSGMQFLLSRQQADGAWQAVGDYRSGSTALALFALMKSGLPRDHPAARRALASLRRSPPDRTYATSLAILAICTFGDPAHDEWLRDLTDDLIEWQQGNGLWAYPYGEGDLSNTQFAALALHAAAVRGIEVPRDTWLDLERATLACRESDSGGKSDRGRSSGFGYNFDGGASASMTAAGVGTLLICAEHLGEAFGPRSRAAVDGGLAWLGGHCPLHAPLSGGWSHYTLYGLERAGALARAERFGAHPWYAEGAALLLERQLGNGAWSGDDVDSSFALLFLTRATTKAAVTQPEGGGGAGRLFASSIADGPLLLRAALGASLDLWVDSASRDFTRYARVVYWLQPPGGEWRQVAGGPSKRHDARVALDRSGVWLARASAFLHDGSSLGSGTLEITLEGMADGPLVESGWNPPDANLLRGGACAATASSAALGCAADGASDQVFATRWACAEHDAAPWLEIRLGRRVKGRTVELRPAPWLSGDDERQPEPARVRVTVNGQESVVADLPAGWPARWSVELGGLREIRSLRIEILAVRRGRLGACSVGFGEVEVHEAAPGQE